MGFQTYCRIILFLNFLVASNAQRPPRLPPGTPYVLDQLESPCYWKKENNIWDWYAHSNKYLEIKENNVYYNGDSYKLVGCTPDKFRTSWAECYGSLYDMNGCLNYLKTCFVGDEYDEHVDNYDEPDYSKIEPVKGPDY